MDNTSFFIPSVFYSTCQMRVLSYDSIGYCLFQHLSKLLEIVVRRFSVTLPFQIAPDTCRIT